MRVEQVVTFLEMTSRDQLSPGRAAPAPVELRQSGDLSSIRATTERVAAPHHWSSLEWSDLQWRDYMAHPHRHHWLVLTGGQVAGLVAVTAQPEGQAEINTFGLVPEFVGKGFGGHVLTAAVELAWDVEPADGTPISRVWLHTSSLDHPHALANYRRRGFRVFRTENRPRDIPDERT